MDPFVFRERLKSLAVHERLAFVVRNRVERTRSSNKCPGCWLKHSNCVCQLWKRVEASTKVVVHIHHCEWGICSNTGISIHRTLQNSLFLLKGLPEDEARLQEIWEDPSYTPCVLWPGDDALTVAELKEQVLPNTQLLLIVPDGTFSNARRMTKKYPRNCLKVGLSSESVLEGKQNSFLYPVRKYGGSESETGRVSTLEAVAAFMREMDEDPSISETLIANMKIQMDHALKQKARAMIYGTTPV